MQWERVTFTSVKPGTWVHRKTGIIFHKNYLSGEWQVWGATRHANQDMDLLGTYMTYRTARAWASDFVRGRLLSVEDAHEDALGCNMGIHTKTKRIPNSDCESECYHTECEICGAMLLVVHERTEECAVFSREAE